MIRLHYQIKLKVWKVIRYDSYQTQFKNLFKAELAELIGEFREGLELGTQWDSTMSSILGMAINSYEINDIYDVAPENSEFQQAVRRTVPTGHTFKGMRFINDYYGDYYNRCFSTWY